MDISINIVENHISKAFFILREKTKSILLLFFKKVKKEDLLPI